MDPQLGLECADTSVSQSASHSNRRSKAERTTAEVKQSVPPANERDQGHKGQLTSIVIVGTRVFLTLITQVVFGQNSSKKCKCSSLSLHRLEVKLVEKRTKKSILTRSAG
jgi:hypothetical protein